MATHVFTSIAADVDVGRLDQEIRRETLTVTFQGLSFVDGELTAYFDAAPASADVTAIQGIIDAHEPGGMPLFRTVSLFDEFFGDQVSSALGWSSNPYGSQSKVDFPDSGGDDAGVIKIIAGTRSDGYCSYYLSPKAFRFGGGESTVTWRIKLDTLSTLTNEYKVIVGLGNQKAGTDHTNGAFFIYDRLSSVNWRYGTCKNGTSTTQTSSTVVVAGSWVDLKMVSNRAGTSVEFFVNNVSIGTVTTNIPAGVGYDCGPSIKIVKSAGSEARGITIDYFSLELLLAI